MSEQYDKYPPDVRAHLAYLRDLQERTLPHDAQPDTKPENQSKPKRKHSPLQLLGELALAVFIIFMFL
jgi:hypothetical protein